MSELSLRVSRAGSEAQPEPGLLSISPAVRVGIRVQGCQGAAGGPRHGEPAARTQRQPRPDSWLGGPQSESLRQALMALDLGAGCQECDACAVLAEASQTIHIRWRRTIKAYKLATIRYKAQKSD